MDFFQCVKKCGLRLHFPSVGILIEFLFFFAATNFDEISGILIIFEKSSPLSLPSSPLSKVFEVNKHIQKLLGRKHRDAFTAVWLHRKPDEKLGFDGKRGTKSFSKAFFFSKMYLLQATNWSWDVPKAYFDITQEWLGKGI